MLSVVTLRVLITAHAALDTMEMEHHATVNLITIIIIIIIIIITIIIIIINIRQGKNNVTKKETPQVRKIGIARGIN